MLTWAALYIVLMMVVVVCHVVVVEVFVAIRHKRAARGFEI
jgi:hypothetical protein